MKIEVELPDPPEGWEWRWTGMMETEDKFQFEYRKFTIPKPPRVLFHRTGECRQPKPGEYFEWTDSNRYPTMCGDEGITRRAWILRREEVAGD